MPVTNLLYGCYPTFLLSSIYSESLKPSRL
nr:MAG TPA: hypothetical protein [Caudoviricetes sp.]